MTESATARDRPRQRDPAGDVLNRPPVSFVERVDRYQRTHRRAGLPIAIVYKFVEDQGTYLAALITYYAIVSLFPLLLLLSTILSFVLAGDPTLQQAVLSSAVGQFPVVGEQLTDPRGVSGSGLGLVVGILGTIYGGLGVAQAAQNAMNTIWQVPRNERPNPIKARVRGIGLLLVVGLSVLGTTALSALGGSAEAFGAQIGVGLKVLLMIASMAINAAIFTLAFRLATARDVSLRATIPGAVIAAMAWWGLQFIGTFYVGHAVKGATAINGVFAIILGLIAWIYLESIIVVLAVEFNAVRELGLCPRSLLTPFTDDVELTSADEAAYTDLAKAQRVKGFEAITVSFEPGDENA